jgi:alkylation response protein AidB-like acyl-CoA dehydrogenase
MSDWESYQKSILRYPELGFTLDCSRMGAPQAWSDDLQGRIARAFRDSRVQTIYGGTTEIMKEIIGRSMGF